MNAPCPGEGFIPAQHAPALPGLVRDKGFCQQIARLAVRSLYAELALYPKPGLVSLVDNGSHEDMTAATFMRSMFALRRYFLRITAAGMADAPFHVLKRLGIEAEQRMLRATSGINTHRGAIFCLGMLCAAIGRCRADGAALEPAVIQSTLLRQWGGALGAHSGDAGIGSGTQSHGAEALQRYAASGAREEGARGFPSVFGIGLPALQRALGAKRGMRQARVDALFALMAHISDTNVYHRGGIEGAQAVRRQARAFVARGGTAAPDWEERALACHRAFVVARLSPGGAADLLGAACLLHAVCAGQG
ncbi:triphosphoribosyl-dephospho-CoA synthase MdcB [Massilia sp. ML15P13]|uniref:Probable 2-(5''-triphosphoribosyl)-3'-dephosphocoenzyme-A synthase n=1 Tax=Telluria aromaticivorans TaxID=2725995 RepID=A0A7Y2JYT0_9BURK|nr:triphosphoribosyl-dephospho-CoA synthase MdcB [Telluria aromaticivorans]